MLTKTGVASFLPPRGGHGADPSGMLSLTRLPLLSLGGSARRIVAGYVLGLAVLGCSQRSVSRASGCGAERAPIYLMFQLVVRLKIQSAL